MRRYQVESLARVDDAIVGQLVLSKIACTPRALRPRT